MKGKKWKILYGLFLGVVSCLLYNTLFTLKNANAAVIEMNAPTSSWINCDGNTAAVEWYTAQRAAPYTSLCSKWSNEIVINSNVDFYRLVISFANTNNEYKFKDKDAYAIVTFSIGVQGTGTELPTGFIGRNVNVIEQSVDFEPELSGLKPVDGQGNNVSSYLATGYESSDFIFAVYTMKIRIPKDTVWNGKLDLQHAMTFPNNNNIFKLFISSVRLGYIFEPDAAIGEEAQKELEDRNNLESQSQQTSGDANSAEQQMSSGTSSLISVVTSFSNAMIGVRRTNCKLPRMTAYDFDLGELDLCTYSPPTWIQTITSAVVSLIVVRLAYKIFKRIMGIAKGISK